MITLKGKDVFSKLIDANQGTHEDKNGVPYYRLAYNGTVFIIRETVWLDWKAGNMRELNLVEGERTLDDGTTANQLQYAGHLTNTQEIAVVKTDVAIKQIERQFDLNEVVVTSEDKVKI